MEQILIRDFNGFIPLKCNIKQNNSSICAEPNPNGTCVLLNFEELKSRYNESKLLILNIKSKTDISLLSKFFKITDLSDLDCDDDIFKFQEIIDDKISDVCKITEDIEIKITLAVKINKILNCPIDFTIKGNLQIYLLSTNVLENEKNKFEEKLNKIIYKKDTIFISPSDNVINIFDNSIPLINDNILKQYLSSSKKISETSLSETLSETNLSDKRCDSIVPTTSKNSNNNNVNTKNNFNNDNIVNTNNKSKNKKSQNNNIEQKYTYFKLYQKNNCLIKEFINEIKKGLEDLDDLTTNEINNLGIMCYLLDKNLIGFSFDYFTDIFPDISKPFIRSLYEKNKQNISVKYLYNLLLQQNKLKLNQESTTDEIQTLLSLYDFKYINCIYALIFRDDITHYKICNELEIGKILSKLYDNIPSAYHAYCKNIVFALTTKVETIYDPIYNYRNVIPFKDCLFDLISRQTRFYNENDYILNDVGYDFPKELYELASSNYEEFYKSSECLHHIKEMFVNPQYEALFWQSMSENLDRTCKYDSLIIFFGSKSNGKGCIFKLTGSAFGTLDVSVGSKYLEKKGSSSSAEPEFYTLLYSFFASVPDFTGTQMSSDRLKMTTTGDRMTFRMLYSNEYISFNPSYSTIVGCNNTPRFTVYDGGIRRRLVIVPFEVTFCSAPREGNSKFKKSDSSIRYKFETDKDWRNQYIVNLIISYFKERVTFTYDSYLKDIDRINNIFLLFLFETYNLDSKIHNDIPFSEIVTSYTNYLIDIKSNAPVNRARLVEICNNFEITYDKERDMICNIERK